VTLAAIVLDFDGTVLESVDTKTRAFRTLFADRPELVDRIVALHLRHGGRSRFEKFGMIYDDILREPRPADGFAALARRFEALVRDEVVACPFVPGADAFLDFWSSRLPLVLVSGTPDEELKSIVGDRRLTAHFDEIHGSPPGKDEILRGLLARRRWSASDVLVVGDALSDWEAAQAVGAHFIGRVAPADSTPFPDGTDTVPDLDHLAVLLAGRPAPPVPHQ